MIYNFDNIDNLYIWYHTKSFPKFTFMGYFTLPVSSSPKKKPVPTEFRQTVEQHHSDLSKLIESKCQEVESGGNRFPVA